MTSQNSEKELKIKHKTAIRAQIINSRTYMYVLYEFIIHLDFVNYNLKEWSNVLVESLKKYYRIK